MTLVWHIAKKDVRRLSGPVGLWLVFVAGGAIWFRTLSAAGQGESAGDVIGWVPMLSIWARLLVGGELFVTYLLAGTLVLEDALVGADGFWMTRPIASARLFAAKALGAFLLFILAPALVTAAIWLGCGFSFGEAGLAGLEFAGWQLVVVLLAFTVASLARNLVRFLFLSITLGGGYIVCGAYGITAPLFALVDPAIRATRNMLVQFGLLPVAALLMVHQFLTRRTVRTWAFIALAFAGCLAIRVAWPWDLSSTKPTRALPEVTRAESPEVTATVQRASLFSYQPRRMTDYWFIHANYAFDVPSSRGGAGIYAAAVGVSIIDGVGGRRIVLPIARDNHWGDAAARQFVLGQLDGAPRWQLSGNFESPVAPAGGAEVAIEGRVTLWRLTPRVLGELPARLGGEISAGGSRTRVVAIDQPLGWNGSTLLLEEHDAQLAAFNGWSPDNRNRVAQDRPDVFVLFNRAAHQARSLSYDEIGSVAMNAMGLGFRRLYLPAVTEQEPWLRDAVILKVRLEHDGEFVRAFSARATIERPEPDK